MGNEQASDKRRSPAYALVMVKDQGGEDQFWLAMQITPELADVVKRGQAIQSLGLREAVLDLQCDGWVLCDDVASTLEGLGYDATNCFSEDGITGRGPDGKFAWLITGDDIKALQGADGLPGTMSGWGRWSPLSVELDADGMRLRVRDYEGRALKSYWQSSNRDVPQMLGTFAMYHDAPPAPSVVDVEVDRSELVGTAESASVTMTPDLVLAIERARMAIALQRNLGLGEAHMVIDGSRWFDFGMEELVASGVDLDGRDESGAGWLMPDVVRLLVFEGGFAFEVNDSQVEGATVGTATVQFENVPELQHLVTPEPVNAPGM
jgi:hypothetical protein